MAANGTDTYITKGGQHPTGFNGLIGHFLRIKGPSGFSSGSTAEDVVASWDGNGKVVLVTGASTGLGLEATRVLAGRGATVIMGVRDVAKANRNADAIKKQQPGADLVLLPLDLASMDSVRKFAEDFLKLGKPLHILMLNAGIMAPPFSLSADGYESQFATNHLGHFLLESLLRPKLLATAHGEEKKGGSKGEGRIVVLSSLAHFTPYPEGLRLVGLDSPLGYHAWNAYGQSKLCNVLFARVLAERLRGQPVRVVACHPGGIPTELSRSLAMPPFMRTLLTKLMTPFMKNIPQGAATQVYCATSPDIISGEYYSDSNLQPSHPLALSRTLAEKLWETSEAICAGTYKKS